MTFKPLVAALALAILAGAAEAADPPATYGDAMRWYERAAAEGSAKAQFLLGRMYEEGAVGRPRDPARAASLYRQAADQGHALAQFSLGVLYLSGRGVGRDPAAAAGWFARAAEQGLREAQFNLGYLYDRGIGVGSDRETAETWYRAAARQGMTRAQINLALVLVAAGPGERDSLVEAWAWLSLAAARGEEHARPLAADLGAKLDAAEKARAEAALEALKADVPAR